MRDKLLLYGEKIRNIDIKLQTITKAYHETLNRIDLLSKTYMDILEHLKYNTEHIRKLENIKNV